MKGMSTRISICLLGLLSLAILTVVAPSGLGFVLAFVGFCVFVDRLIALFSGALNRVCRRCRNALESGECRPPIVDHTCDVNQGLRETLASLRMDESRIATARASRRCSEADLARAVSKRLLAEIELIRHERMPRAYSEITRDRS